MTQSNRTGAVCDGELVAKDFITDRLQGTLFDNPLQFGVEDGLDLWVNEERRILYSSYTGTTTENTSILSFTAAGLHKKLHFKPEDSTIGVVTCGGLCPGLNDVIRSIVYQALDMYHVKRVIGFRYGYYGLTKQGMKHAMILDHQVVANCNLAGGTVLGSSRGPQNPDEMVNTLVDCQIDALICIGGDGTQRGALQIAEVVARRGLDIGVVGVPKTIDNDLAFIDRTFGFDTAVQVAVQSLKSALWEAKSHLYGVGLVKLMGRNAGFIAAQATLASQAAHICLIPEHEIPFETICMLLERRFSVRTYCVICVAEGFGQRLMHAEGDNLDASGNVKFGDIGIWLRDKIDAWLKANKDKYIMSTVKYIDPSYTIRSCPASSNDAAFCVQLGNCAVHEAMHGTTSCLIGFWAGLFTAVPTKLATRISKKVDLQGILWRSVREVTVSKRLKRVGCTEEEHDVLNLMLLNGDKEEETLMVTQLTSRVQELERMILTIRDREEQKDSHIQKMKAYTSHLEAQLSSPVAAAPKHRVQTPLPDDEYSLLEALEQKYARMKERMYRT